jgi:hypothetical protein
MIKAAHATTLFGKHLGELYRPSNSSKERLRQHWTRAPQGQEYLVAPVSILKDIKQNSIKEGEVDETSHEIA